MRNNSEYVEKKNVPKEFDAKEHEWLQALNVAAEYTDAADTLRRTIIKVGLSKTITREEKETAIDVLTRSIGVLMNTMANEILYNFDD